MRVIPAVTRLTVHRFHRIRRASFVLQENNISESTLRMVVYAGENISERMVVSAEENFAQSKPIPI